MHLIGIGISHHTADVGVREKLAMNEEQVKMFLSTLHEAHPQTEFALISTCNRTELYMARPLHGHPRLDEVISHFAHWAKVTVEELKPVVYHHENKGMLEHLFRVGAGLESMVLGENQILGQIRQAYEHAQQAGTTGPALHKLFQSALRIGKKVRTETGINEGRTSVSSVAVQFAKQLFDDLSSKRVLAIGAGKMTELTLQHFMEHSPKELLVCNRSLEKAQSLAVSYDANARGFDELEALLVEADIVISSTGAREPIVTLKDFQPLMKKRRFRPLFVVDIAMPRDFESAVGDVEGVYLYNLDDLQQVLDDTVGTRESEKQACEEIIAHGVKQCYAEVQNEDFSELIQLLRGYLHELGQAESQRVANRLLHADDDEQVQAILDEFTHRLINKILHRPLGELKNHRPVASAMYATALRRLFALDGELEDMNLPEPNVIKDMIEESSRQSSK